MVAALLLAAATGAVAGVVVHDQLGSSSPPPIELPRLYGQAVWPAGRRPAPAVALRDQDGRLVSLAAERGRTVVIAFVDPRCGGACLLEGRALAELEREVGPARKEALLIVSLDSRATRTEAVATGRAWGLTGDWHWLLGRRSELVPVWNAYGIATPAASTTALSTLVYVIDRRGFERAGVHAPFLPQFIADDLRALAREPA